MQDSSHHLNLPATVARSIDPQVILDRTSDSIFAVDRDWHLLFLNRRAMVDAQCGSEVLGEKLWAAFPELLGTGFEQAYREAMAERVPTKAEELYPPFKRWFVANAYPLDDGLIVFFRNTTADREGKAAIRASEERFRVLFTTLTEGVIFRSAEGVIIDVNLAAEEILGFCRDEILGRASPDPRWQVTDEHGRSMAAEDYPAIVALRTGRTVRHRVMGVVNPKLEERRWLEVDAIPQFQSGESRAYQVYTLFSDVTERKRAEDALRESEARLQSITRNLPVIVFQRVLGRDGKISYPYYNAAMANLLDGEGTVLTAPDAARVWAAIHADDRKGLLDSIKHSAVELSPWSHEHRMLRRDGTARWVMGRGLPRRLENGDTVWDAAVIDITEQKKAEVALRESEAHLARAQRVATVGSAEIDFRTGTWKWSQELYRIYGLDPAAFSPCYELLLSRVQENDRERFKAGFEALRRGVNPEPIEYRIVRPDGEVRTIYREAELIRDDTGEVVGALGTTHDVTELRAAEQKQQELQNRLMHTQRLEELGTLTGGIAHDLNNTLVPVVALSESLRRALPKGHPDEALLLVIRQAGERARDLVRQILTFSRRDTPDKRKIDLTRFLQETMRLMRASIPTTIEIKERIERVPTILVDPSQIHQVIVNLVANAADAIGSGIGTITISLSTASRRVLLDDTARVPSCVQLSVTDTGAGMDDLTLKRIFEPFFTTKEVGRGTGLGLAIVHGIVLAHEGRIAVASGPGKGTRVDVILPALVEDNARKSLARAVK